jgi:hypothetical protein
MLAVAVMTVLMIAPIHLVVTSNDRHVEMISMRIMPVMPLYNRPELFMYIAVNSV